MTRITSPIQTTRIGGVVGYVSKFSGDQRGSYTMDEWGADEGGVDIPPVLASRTSCSPDDC